MALDRLVELLNMPNAQGRDGIHVSAQLRIDAMQLRAHGIAWAAATMETAAARIDELEDRILKQPEAAGGGTQDV